jgi:hypothetical protein
MPLFIFTSGGLLFLSRINKGWPVGRLYVDKVRRILVPMVFFVTVYYLLKMAMAPFVKTQTDISITDFLLSFAIYYRHPSEHLWFLMVLMWFMLMYPLFRYLCKSNKGMVCFLLCCAALHFVEIPHEPEHNYFYLFTVNHYLFFFFSGIFFFKYKLYDYLNGWKATLLFAALYVLFYQVLVCWFLASITGILAIISLCRLVARYLPGLFGSFRDYIYQIYLLSLIFQGVVELILWQKLFYSPSLLLFFFVLNVLFGIYGPVLIAKVVERTPWQWLHLLFGLKK